MTAEWRRNVNASLTELHYGQQLIKDEISKVRLELARTERVDKLEERTRAIEGFHAKMLGIAAAALFAWGVAAFIIGKLWK